MIHLVRRLLLFGFLSSLALIFAIVLIVKLYGETFLKTYIENDVAEKIGAQIHLDAVKIKYIPPFTARLEKFNLTAGNQEVSVESVDLFLDVLKMFPRLPELFFSVKATLTKPVMTVKLPFLPAQKISPPPTQIQVSETTLHFPPNLNINFEIDIQDGKAEVLQQGADQNFSNLLRVDKLFSTLKAPSLSEAWDFTLISHVSYPKLTTLALPLEVKSRMGIDTTPLRFKVDSADLRIGGVPGKISGWFDPSTMYHAWNIQMNVEDLGKIRSFSIPGTWQGSLFADIKLEKKEALKTIASVQLKNVYGDLEYIEEGAKLSGSIGINGSSQFTYDNSIKIDSLNFAVNLTNMALGYKNLFKKERAISFTALGSASSEGGAIKIKQLNFELAQLKGSFSGSLGMDNVSDSFFKIVIQNTNLQGMEKYFPMIKSPIVGTAQANIEMRGNLAQPDKLFVDINPLILRNVRLDTSWESEDETKSVEGLFTIDTQSHLKISDKQLQSSTTSTQLDLTRVGVKWGDIFVKEAGSPFRFDIRATQKDFSANIDRAEIATPAGIISAKGNFRDPLKPDMNFSLQSLSLDLTRLSQMIPPLKKWKLSGKATGDIQLVGRFDPELGIEKTPLKMSGSLKAHLPEFAYETAEAKDGKILVGEDKKTNTPQSILPNWPILLNSSVKTELSIGKLNYKDLVLEGLLWRGALDRGSLNGQLDIKKFFAGTIAFTRVKIPLKDPLPTIQMSSVWGDMEAGKAFDWFLPNWKDQFSGKSSGNMDLTLLHPSHPDFLKESVVHGRISIKDAFLSTFKFDVLVNEKLAVIPGIGNNANINTRGVAGTVEADFDYSQNLMKFRNLSIVTPEKNELKAEGWVKTDKTIDIKGDVYLVKPFVQGSVRIANSDKSGRFMVPVQFDGEVTNPHLNIAEQTIKIMLTKTAEFESVRLRAEAQKALNVEAEKAKKAVGEEIKKGIKNIFGK